MYVEVSRGQWIMVGVIHSFYDRGSRAWAQAISLISKRVYDHAHPRTCPHKMHSFTRAHTHP